jgi:hypothetical protein
MALSAAAISARRRLFRRDVQERDDRAASGAFDDDLVLTDAKEVTRYCMRPTARFCAFLSSVISYCSRKIGF